MEFFVPLWMIQVRVYSVEIPLTTHKGHQYVVSGWRRQLKWLSAIIYSDIQLAKA